MRLASTGLTATGVLGITCALLAIVTLWMLLTDPLTVATAVSDGGLAAMLDRLGHALEEAVRALLKYL